MRTVRDIKLLENVPVLVRAPLNEPVEKGVVTDVFRLKRVVPTLRYLADHGARVVVISHIGDKGTETLAPVADALTKLTPGVSFFPETIGERARAAVRELSPGHILVLENLRRHKGETANDPAFARELAALADVFVQDSFDTCHRVHASIVGLPALLPSYAGLLLEEEVSALSGARDPEHPAVAIIGGAKFSSKEAVLNALLEHYDHVFIGGALANDFMKASGREVGQSLVSDAPEEEVRALIRNPRLVLPQDVRVISAQNQGDVSARAHARVAASGDIRPNEIILDEGPETSAVLAELVKGAKAVLWNGPLGNYENGFGEATDDLARAIAASAAHSVVGGGNTVASIESLGLMEHFSFVSTGGGAMLAFLVKGTLPGIDALTPHESA